MQIRKDLYQVGGSLNGLSWRGNYANYEDANAYILDTGSGLILFDCGNGETFGQIERNMARWGLNPSDIIACLITHAHLDHSGAAASLHRRGIALYAHRETAEALAQGDERCCGFLYHMRYEPCAGVRPLEDGQELSLGGVAVGAMHLPGHSMGCCAYTFRLGDETVVVSGDVIGTLLDGYTGWNGSIDFDKKVYLDSLRRFARFDSDIMLPGHGLIYFTQPRLRVEEALCNALSAWR